MQTQPDISMLHAKPYRWHCFRRCHGPPACRRQDPWPRIGGCVGSRHTGDCNASRCAAGGII